MTNRNIKNSIPPSPLPAEPDKKKNIHVTRNSTGDWNVVVVVGNSSSINNLFRTQRQAIEHAKNLAKTNRSDLVIHGANGEIRIKHSYRQDPGTAR